MGERSTAQILAYAAAAVLVAIVGVRFLSDGDGEAPPPTVALDETGAGSGNGSGGEENRLYVHVAGAVRRAGLYKLPAGSRVGAAIERAGGTEPRADLSGVNLAAEVQDGQQVLVPKRGEVAATAATLGASGASSVTGTTGTGAPAAPVSLAQATPEQLDAAVDGIGPTLAARIIEFREERGSVGSIDELAEVDGIGDTRLAALREALVP
jgi:competence protein ComEA